MLLLTFPPTIGLAGVVGLGIGIGWILVGQVRMWCLLLNVGVVVEGVCVWWLELLCGLEMRAVSCAHLRFVELCGGDRILESGLCMLLVLGGVLG